MRTEILSRRPLPAAWREHEKRPTPSNEEVSGLFLSDEWGRRGGLRRRPRAGRDSWVSNTTDADQRAGARAVSINC
jgi:hypothetical protein